MKKIITIFLALLMISSLLVACTNPDQGDGTQAATDATDATKAPGGDSDSGSVSDTDSGTIDDGSKKLPEDLNFDNAKVQILCWNSERPEFEIEESDIAGDKVDAAIYKRNLFTEQNLGVDLVFTSTAGDGNNQQAYVDFATKDAQYDIFASYSRTTALCVINNLCTPIDDLENLYLDQSWWSQRLNEKAYIEDHLYFASGDISTNLLYMMYSVFYNNSLLTEQGLEFPPDLVKDYTWTMDKLIEMTKDAYMDNESDATNVGVKDVSDKFGLTAADYHLDAVYHGAGFTLVLPDATKIIKLSDDFTSSLIVSDFIATIGKWCTSNDVYIETNYSGEYGDVFNEGNSLFMINRVKDGIYLLDVSFTWGVVPMPMLEADKQYITCLGNPFTLYAIAKNAADIEIAGTTLESLAELGYEYTTPAVFDATLKGRYSKEEITFEMFDYIKNGVDYDLGRLYFKDLNCMPDIVTGAMKNNKEWSGVLNTNLSVLKKRLNKLITKLQSLDD